MLKSVDIVHRAILAQGALYVQIPSALSTSDLSLRSNGTQIPLHPLTKSEFSKENLPVNHIVSVDLSPRDLTEYLFDGTKAPSGTRMSVNALEDWSLENARTCQIRIGAPEKQRLIVLGKSFDAPATGKSRFFETLLAVHRCEAELLVSLDPVGTGDPVDIAIPIRPQHTGGRLREGYQQISVPLPEATREYRIGLAIRYLRHSDEGTGLDPYVFVADPAIVTRQEAGNGANPRLLNLREDTSGDWAKAHVPVFRSPKDSPLILASATRQTLLFAPDENEVVLEEDQGHSLVLRAMRPQTFLVYIDAAPIQKITITPDPSAFRLPERFLCGDVIEVQIRDLSGSQIFLTVPLLAPRYLTPHDILLRETRRPFPVELPGRVGQRYASLRAHLSHPLPGLDQASLSTALETLDGTYESVEIRPLCFPAVAAPDVSIIIPAHNHAAITYYALCALLVAHNRASFEVILVDDGSTDQTATIEDTVSGITVVRNATPQRFIRACNAGAAVARGTYIALLNNDTEVTCGWLDHLVEAFSRFDKVGAVGAKLLYPDGRLQDAGGLVWNTGNPWNTGQGESPWDPRFCYARQVDYLSGAALMTRREIWQQVGGLSDYLEAMYFEDTDFAFKIRDAGLRTYIVPSSVVYHFEGATSGVDTSSGCKKYQEINRPRFKRRWARDFRALGAEGERPDLARDRGIIGRVLFVDYTTPREDRDAGSYAACREIALIQSLGYKVTFLPENLAHFGCYTEEMERNGVEMVYAPFTLSFEEFLERRAQEFDAVYITRYHVAQQVIPLLRRLNPRARIILNNADLHFLRELRAALSENDQGRLARMRSIRDEELEMMQMADVVLSYNEVEHAIIASHTEGRARVMTCPWVAPVPQRVPGLKSRKGLSFLGSFKHHPNAEGLRWFCSEVMPMIAAPDTTLSIYGSGMTDDIRALADRFVTPVGFVEEAAQAYDRHRVFIAPLLSGAGIKGKVIGALAHGIPTVLTPTAAEGIGLRHRHDCMIVETPQDWAEAIQRLTTDNALWSSLSKAGRAYATERFSFNAGREKMKAAFEAVDLFGAI